MAHRDPRVGAARRRARARAAVDRAGGALGRAGVPGRPRRAVLRLPSLAIVLVRRHDHRRRTGRHRADRWRRDAAAALVLAALIAVESAIFATGVALLAISAHRSVLHRAEGLLLGLAAGALFGVSDVAIKYLTHAEGRLHGLVSPWTLTALVAGTIAFYASARSLQLGPAVQVIAFTSVAANLTAIIGGILVFGEPIGSGPITIGARLLAFCLVITGAALMPAQHAEQPEPATAPPLAASVS